MMNDSNATPATTEKFSLEMFLRKFFKGLIDPFAKFLLRIGLKPNIVTYIGLFIATGASALAATGHIQIAGLLLAVGAPLDVVDGSMARLLGEPSRYGAFIDSVTDRYSELVLFGGLLIFYALQGDVLGCILVFFATGGSIMVSYVKARAEGLNYTAKTGLLTRVERLIIMVACLLINIPIVALWIIAILANFTAVQRILYVRKQALTIK